MTDNQTAQEILRQPFYKVGKLNISRKVALECVIHKPVLLSRMQHLSFYKNEKFLLEAIEFNCVVIRYMDKVFKQQLKFMLKVSKIKNVVRYCYTYATTEIQLNKQFKINLINNNINDTLRLINFYVEPDIIKLGLEKNHKVFRVLNIHIQNSFTNTVINAKELIEMNPLLYEYLPRQLKLRTYLIKIALSKDPFVFTLFRHMIVLDKDTIKELININPFIIQYLSDTHKNDKELMMHAISKNGLVLKYILNRTRTQIFCAIISNKQVLTFFKEESITFMCNNLQTMINTNNCMKLFLESCSQCIRNNNPHEKLTYHGFWQGLKLKKHIIKYIVGDIHVFKKYYKLSVKALYCINEYMLLKN